MDHVLEVVCEMDHKLEVVCGMDSALSGVGVVLLCYGMGVVLCRWHGCGVCGCGCGVWL